MNSRVRQIRAVGASILTPHVDVAHARIEFENGCIANLTASRVSEEKVRRTQIFQSNGTFWIDFLAQKASFSEKRVSKRVRGGPSAVARELPVKRIDSLEAEIKAFLLSVKNAEGTFVSPEGKGSGPWRWLSGSFGRSKRRSG